MAYGRKHVEINNEINQVHYDRFGTSAFQKANFF